MPTGGANRLKPEYVSSRFIEEGFEIIGIYVKMNTPVLTLCGTCGHKFKRRAKLRKLSHQEIESRAMKKGIEVIGEYEGVSIPVLLRCNTCKHEWRASLSNGNGCPKCSHVERGKARRNSYEEVVRRFRENGAEILGPYRDVHTHVLTRYIECGHEKLAIPLVIMHGGGCRECSWAKGGVLNRLSQNEVRYRYRAKGCEILEPYVNLMTPILVRHKCGHERLMSPFNILYSDSGDGSCPDCTHYGFHPNKPAILYYIKVPNPWGTPLYKIGITNRTVAKRFAGEKIEVEILRVDLFKKGSDALAREQEILITHAESRYFGPDVLESGNNELFTEDVLNLDHTEYLIMETF